MDFMLGLVKLHLYFMYGRDGFKIFYFARTQIIKSILYNLFYEEAYFFLLIVLKAAGEFTKEFPETK